MMLLGVDYYPEQWDPALMEADLDAIREMGGNTIRIAEFSWHLMEPEEGHYDFSFFDHVIAMAREKGLRVILGTPTAAIPAWLANRHPDILSRFENGQPRAFGGRHVYCCNSPRLYEYSEKIIRAMAGHYKDEPQIAAWQIDNEIGHEDSDLCWCPRCREAFRRFLRDKFGGDVHRLNETYGTAFWSQEYNDFDEIPLPAPTITTHNPALRLDWERFRSKSLCDFLDFQARLIREIDPQAVIIHDFPGGGLDKHVDYSQAAKCLDTAAYNNYPVWGGQKEPLPPHETAFALDHIRGLKRKNFWITEAIMGAQGHDVTGYLPRPGQAKLWSWQGMAHGCESLLYFRYRGAAKGAEQFSLASFRIQRQSLLLDCPGEMKKLYKAFYDRNISVDVIPAEADLTGYQIVLLPQLTVMKPEFQAKAERFVREGGTLVLTYRTGVKDPDNNLFFGEVLPVGYAGLAGVTVAETESLQEQNAFPVVGEGAFAGADGYGGVFRDMLEVRDAEVLYRYGDSFYREFAAATRKRQGPGAVYYLGCSLDEGTISRLAETILAERGIEAIPSPEGVEIVTRGGAGQKIRMLMNHTAFEAEALGITLPPYGCVMETLIPCASHVDTCL